MIKKDNFFNQKSFLPKFQQGRKIRYSSKYTGNVYDTKEEAIEDNRKYFNDPEYRYGIKGDKVQKPAEYDIPFIDSKKITLTNAGLATGAVLSTNILDTIANYATAVGLPIKTALGLAVKESTLGNPTDDKSIYNILNPMRRAIYKTLGTGQHINKGTDFPSRELINWYKDEFDPYQETIEYIRSKHMKNGLDREKFNDYLIKGERYADKQVKQYEEKYGNNNVLYNGFKHYKDHPNDYNPNQDNYSDLVNKRAEEIWGSPEIQEWYKQYLNSKKSGGILELLKKGSGIHIKKENKGKFTDYCGGKVTSECIAKGKSSSNPAIRKRATFADNARHFKHRSGGQIVQEFKLRKMLNDIINN